MTPKGRFFLMDKVEVRQLKEGLRGSWHPGVIVHVSHFHRSVKYDKLLSEIDGSNLIESIPFTGGIEVSGDNYRGRIRPCPAAAAAASDVCKSLKFGRCVDAFFQGAWWEGVVFDQNDGADKRMIYFPDEQDEQIFNIKDLRITRDWNKTLGVWEDRGVWKLIAYAEEFCGTAQQSCGFAKKVWPYLQENADFKRVISEWSCSEIARWNEYLLGALCGMKHDVTSPTVVVDPFLKDLKKKFDTVQTSQDNRKESCSIDCPDHFGFRDVHDGRSRKRKLHDAACLSNCSKKSQKIKASFITDSKQIERKQAPRQFRSVNSNAKPQHEVNENVVISSENCLKNIGCQGATLLPLRKSKRKSSRCDTVCSICDGDGELIHCDHCSSSYHLNCLRLEAVPSEIWLCPLCSCSLCGSECGKDEDTGTCQHCSREYHLTCASEAKYGCSTDYPSEFCSKTCYELCLKLHSLLGKSNQIADSGLTWSLVRKSQLFSFPGVSRSEKLIKPLQILKVLHECFKPMKDPHTRTDIIKDIVYNSHSRLKRMNFTGFYTMVLRKGEEITSVAMIRFHGTKAVEIPFVATPFKFRGQGMCRALMNELFQLLTQLGIERALLEAIPTVEETWKTKFGFSEMSDYDRQQFLSYSLLAFQGTKMLQRFLAKEATGKSDTSQNPDSISSSSSLEAKSKQTNRKRRHGLISSEEVSTNMCDLRNKRIKCNSHEYKQCIKT